MATGLSGSPGKSALKHVDKATRQEPELVAVLQLNMVEGHVMAMLWSRSCATSDPVQVRMQKGC